MSWSSLSGGKQLIVVATATAASVAVGACILYLGRKRQSQLEEEQKYELVGRVSALRIYPVKSCAGIDEQEGLITRDGFKAGDLTDRHYLLIRENGDFITQRQNALMSAIKTSTEDGYLVLSSEKMDRSIRVPLTPTVDKSKIINCRVWKSRIDGLDLGDEASAWISEVLGETIRIVVAVPGGSKIKATKPNAVNTDTITYQDGAPMHITTEASLADLVSRIPENSEDGVVTMTNFRPNIVISGSKAWDEDNWSFVKIGQSAKLRLFFPCDRCLLTTVNPNKHERRSDGEPLETLKTFRMMPELSNSPIFGMYGGVSVEGKVQVGDPVYALRK